MRNRTKRWMIGAALTAVMAGSTGCSAFGFPVPDLGSFIAGWLAAGFFGTTTTCYVNGEKVDCKDLPANVQP